jgi:TonB-linked SusC/RagA family outer membrane protein
MPVVAYPATATASPATADELTVSSVVVDASGEPLIGCGVVVKGTSQGCSTDIDGKFSLQVKKNAILVISYIGYKTKELKATSVTDKIVLEEGSIMLDEVVAVGYGKMKRSDVTGSVVSVGGDDLQTTQASTFDQMLQGQAAGVQLNLNNGAAGASSSVQIRGVNSLSSTNEPIYVIDGSIVQSSNGADVYSNPLADINPDDIERIEILKDASATAIYGAQAANGVVLVTMKKGQEGNAKIKFKANFGWDHMPKYIDVMNLQQFAAWNQEAKIMAGEYTNNFFASPSTLGDGSDWQRALYRSGFKQEYNLSVSGGTKSINYNISGSYLDQTGIIINNDFSRFTLRGSLNVKAYKWLDLGLTANIGQTEKNTGMADWAVVGNALYQAPNISIVNQDGSWGKTAENDESSSYTANPIAVTSVTTRKNSVSSFRGNIFADIKPWKWLTWHNEFTYDVNTDNYRYLVPAYDFGGTPNTSSTHRQDKTFNKYLSFKSFPTVHFKMAGVHDLTVMAGMEINSRTKDYLQGVRLDGSTTDTSLSAGDPTQATAQGYMTTTKYSSVYGRASYSYDDRYLLTATLRRDGSSHFERGHRWGTFPSASFAWRIDQEPFFLPYTETVNNFKFRFGFGIVGNANLADNTYWPTYTVNQTNFGTGYATANMPNYNGLTWEKTNSYNLGLDLAFLNNRIEFIGDIYLKDTRDLLLQTSLPYYTGTILSGGTTAQWANIGSMKNKGIELTLIANVVNRKNFKWKTTVTYTMVNNKITGLNTENGYIDKKLDSSWSGNETVTRTAVGHGVSEFYGYQLAGRINSAADYLRDNGDGTSTVIAATPNYRVGTVVSNANANNLATSIGDFLFKDNNGDGIIDSNDMTYLGSPLPKFTLGWNNQITYRDFKLTIFLYASVGNKIFNWLRRRLDEPSVIGGSQSNKSIRAVDYAKWAYYDGNTGNKNIWNVYVADGADDLMARIDNDNGNYNSRVSDRYVEDGSYLRIKNIALTYSLKQKYLKKMHLQALRFTLNVQNVWTFTKYTGYDPEVGAQNGQYSFRGSGMLLYGVDTGRVPAARSFSFAVEATF